MADRHPGEEPGETSMSSRTRAEAPAIPLQHPWPPAQLPFPEQQQEAVPPQDTMLQRLLQRITGTTLPSGQQLHLSLSNAQRPLPPPTELGSLSPRLSALAAEAQQAPAGPGVALPPGLQAQPDAEASLEGRAAEAAERHRLNTSLANLDIRQLAISLERGLPFVVLLMLLFIYQHAIGLLSFGWLTYVLHRLNKTIRTQVSLKSQLECRQLLAAAAVVLLQVPLVCAVTWKQSIYRNIVLLGPGAKGAQFWDVVFSIIVGDALVRYIAVLAKVVVLLAIKAEASQQFRYRGHVLTAVEYVLAMWRGLMPIPLWYSYLQEVPGLASALSTVWSGVYLILKCSNVYERAAAASLSLRQAWQKSAYGCPPTPEELAEVGNNCPICQESLRGPIRLQCSHVFCDDCIGEWLERGGNCPMCRANIRPNQLKSYADGHTSLLPILF